MKRTTMQFIASGVSFRWKKGQWHAGG